MMTRHITPREASAILAGLRLLQHGRNIRPEDVYDILTDAGRVTPLSNAEIDRLAERFGFDLDMQGLGL